MYHLPARFAPLHQEADPEDKQQWRLHQRSMNRSWWRSSTCSWRLRHHCVSAERRAWEGASRTRRWWRSWQGEWSPSPSPDSLLTIQSGPWQWWRLWWSQSSFYNVQTLAHNLTSWVMLTCQITIVTCLWKSFILVVGFDPPKVMFLLLLKIQKLKIANLIIF